MKNIFIIKMALTLSVLAIFNGKVTAQSFDPNNPPEEVIKWSFSAEKNDNGEYTLSIHAVQLFEDWHFWTLNMESDFLIPTTVKIFDSATYEFIEDMEQVGDVTVLDDEDFGEVSYYDGDVVFIQRFKPVDGQSTNTINGSVVFQSCSNTICLKPRTIPFTVSLPQ